MKKWAVRFFYGFLFAVPLMLVTYVFAQASPSAQVEKTNGTAQTQDCQTCHLEFQTNWAMGAHGNANTTEAFKQAWEAAGKTPDCLNCHVTGYDPETNTWEEDGITCNRCHESVTSNHPSEPMEVNRSPELCGECHTETYFEWQISSHRDKDLGCSSCHDPHGNQLKANNSATLCAACHQARATNFTHTKHSQQGLQCSDCHMANLSETGTGGHARKDHSFFVSLKSCNDCHVYEMHDPSEVHPEPTPVAADPMASVETLSVVATPKSVSPLGFAVVAGLLGLAAGVIVAPWLERFQNKQKKHDKGE